MNSIRYRQSGMTLISFLVVFIVAGFFVLLILKMVPVYLENLKIVSSLDGLKNESGIAEKSPKEIKQLLQKRWDVNSVDGITAEDSVVIEKKGGLMTIQVAYEVEKPFLANMSILVKFDNSVTVGSSN